MGDGWWICTVCWGLILTLKQFLQEVFIQRWQCMCAAGVWSKSSWKCLSLVFWSRNRDSGCCSLKWCGMSLHSPGFPCWEGGGRGGMGWRLRANFAAVCQDTWRRSLSPRTPWWGGSDLLSSKDVEHLSDTDQTLKLWSWAGRLQRCEWVVVDTQHNLRSSRMGSACLSAGQYSHLVSEYLASQWNPSSSSICWIDCLPLELLRKVFLHLSMEELKVGYIQS